jgi:hypothetical protein
MGHFLLTISIIFNFVNLFIIVILWKKYSISDLTEIEKAKNEIEDLLIAYTAEMKDDNEKLMQQLIDNQQVDESNSPNKINTEKTNPEHKINVLIDNEVILEPPISTPDSQVVESQEEVIAIKSIKEQAVMLSKQNVELEEIAKKLGKGKGEIELLLKFHKD